MFLTMFFINCHSINDSSWYLLLLGKILGKAKIFITISNTRLKETDIKNCNSYYFDDIITAEDFDFNNILIDKKSYKKN